MDSLSINENSAFMTFEEEDLPNIFNSDMCVFKCVNSLKNSCVEISSLFEGRKEP